MVGGCKPPEKSEVGEVHHKIPVVESLMGERQVTPEIQVSEISVNPECDT